MKSKNLIAIFIGGAVFLVSGFLFFRKINAYGDQTTHPDLTREIISFYELSTGKKLSEEQKQWVIQGSIDEDFAPRWLNHFYDPILDRGLDTSVLFVNGYSSKNWGLYSKYQLAKLGQTGTMGVIIAGKSDPSSMPFVFSYEAGIERYAKNREKICSIRAKDRLSTEIWERILTTWRPTPTIIFSAPIRLICRYIKSPKSPLKMELSPMDMMKMASCLIWQR